MGKWVVTFKQFSRVGNRYLNEFSFSLNAANRPEAIEKGYKEVEHWSHIQTIHQDTQEYMKLQRRPYRKITWQGARTILVSAKQVTKK